MTFTQIAKAPGFFRIERILFANNFSDSSAMALVYAAALARHFHAEILAEHVIPADEYADIAPEQLEGALAAMKQKATEQIRTLLSEARFSDISFRISIDHGEVCEAVVDSARRNGVDLIAAGSHGRHGVQKLISVPVDEEIAGIASCPVLLVGPHVTVAPEAESHILHILHATNLQPESRPALEYAYGLAQAYGADLRLMHVTDDALREPLATRISAEAFCRLRLLESELPEPAQELATHFVVDFGDREALIVEAAQRQEAQLIVMGVRAMAHPELASHLPGPLSYNVASHAPCPVLAVRNSVEANRKQ